jgi:signal transduction histidine kinase/ActR/RegA family two-component response regulator
MRDREILIVEDDAAFRRSIKFALKNNNYTFFEAESVREGVGQLDENPNIQVILLDLSLPDGTGKDFLEQIRRRAARYRVIILTAHEEELAAEQASGYGVFNYLPKAARSFTQAIRFSVEQAFRDIESELLNDKTEVLIEIQKRINADVQEGKTYEVLNGILNLICRHANHLIGSNTCHIRLYNLKKGDFDLAAFAGPSNDVRQLFDRPKRKGEFFSGKVAEAKSPLLFDDLQNNKDFKTLKEGLLQDRLLARDARDYLAIVQSMYIAPITTRMFGDEVDAMLNVSSDSVGFFSEEKQEIVKDLVTQATSAINKAWQKKREEETYKDYKGISKVLEEISRKLREVDVKTEIYDIVIKGISEIIRPETISIFLHNKTTGLLTNEAEFRGDRIAGLPKTEFPTAVGLTGAVFTSGESLRIPNLQNQDRSRPQEHPNFNETVEADYIEHIPSGRINHYLGVPMIIGNEVIGAIQLLNKKSEYYGKMEDRTLWLLERGFSDDEETVLGIAASHLAVAINNAELVEERGRKISQLETLKDVGRYTSSEMPLDELLNRIIKEAAEVIEAEICLLFLLNESKSQVVLEQCYGISKESLEDANYDIGRGLTGRVAQTGQPILITADIPLGKYDEGIVRHLRQTRGGDKTIESLMVVPIKVKNEVLGVIKAINKKGGVEQYNLEDLRFFEIFANYVGIAIENAQRYNLTNEKLAIAEKNVALSHLVRAVVHEINNTKALIPINVQMIRERIARSNYDIDEMIDVIADSADRAVEFANSIQAFSAGRLGRREAQDINTLIKKAIQQLTPGFERDRKHKLIKLEENLAEDLPLCSVYQIPFIQVIQNIILNAYQAMERSNEKILRITSYRDAVDNSVNIEFTDTGHGINMEIIKKIFDPEFTTKEGRGTGIGLWLAKTHLNSIDADIRVKSVLNKGTTFIIKIPVIETGAPEQLNEPTD